MKYTTPNYEVEVVETNDVITVSVANPIYVNGNDEAVGTVQTNEENGTVNVKIPEVGKVFI